MHILQISSTFYTTQSEMIQGLTQWPLHVLGATVAIGFLAMTIIEMQKQSSRHRFYSRRIYDWVSLGHVDHRLLMTLWADIEIPKWLRDWKQEPSSVQPLQDLILISTGGDKEALYSLSVENLCGQIAVGIQSVLDYPSHYRVLLLSLIGNSINKEEVRKDYFTLMEYNYSPDFSQEQSYQKYIEARNRIGGHIQRNIDSLQISLSFAWKSRMRKLAFVYSLVISLLGCFLFASSINIITKLIVGLFLGYIATFFASMLRDIISNLEKSKK